MPGYRIKGWGEHFECNKSRERDRCSWVPMPNKVGMGLTRILSRPDGAAMFGIWVLIVQACSRQKRPRDGHLTDTGRADGGHWTVADMSVMWRRPEAEIQAALDLFCSKSIGWMEAVEEMPAKCPESAREVPARCPPSAQEGKEGKEGKGREGSLREGEGREPRGENRFRSPGAAASQVRREKTEISQETSENEPPGERKATAWGCWVDAHRALGRPDPVRVGKDLAAAKEIGRLMADGELENVRGLMEKYLQDEDRFVKSQGHPLRLFLGRLNAYRAAGNGDPFPGTPWGTMPESEMSRIEALSVKGAAS